MAPGDLFYAAAEGNRELVGCLLNTVNKEAMVDRRAPLFIASQNGHAGKAYDASRPGTIIALLGKGLVEYQHIKETKYPFSEKAILRSL